MSFAFLPPSDTADLLASRSSEAPSITMEGHDTTFLITSAFSVDSGIRPRSVFRNLAPAELYEMVGAVERVV